MRDFKHTENGDIDLSTGDILMAESTLQHQRDVILTRPGALKHAPARGVGIEDFFNDDSQEDMLRKIRQESIKDGMAIKSLNVDENGYIKITGYYEADFNR